jgi:anti-sigma B factor antagonist
VTLEIDANPVGDRMVMTPRGDIDLATNAAFRAALDDAFSHGPVDLVLDLNEVTFIDSTGLGTLISARRRAHVFKGSLLLVCGNEVVLRVLRITGLDRVFDMVPTLGETTAEPPVPTAG